jgi:hypothetical protein
VLENDVITFGQSIRIYHLKGANGNGGNNTTMTSNCKWPRVKLKAPKVSTLTRAVFLPKIKRNSNSSNFTSTSTTCTTSTTTSTSTSNVTISSQVTKKIVHDICYGTNSEEKTKRFLSNVQELSTEAKKVSFKVLKY